MISALKTTWGTVQVLIIHSNSSDKILGQEKVILVNKFIYRYVYKGTIHQLQYIPIFYSYSGPCDLRPLY